MKKSVALVTLSLIIAFTSHATSHRFDHSRLHLGGFLNYGSGIVTAGNGFAVDEAHNYYVSGHWVGESQFGEEVVKSSGHRSGFVAKYDREKNLLWSQTFPSTTLPGVAAAGTNGVFIAGHFSGETVVGTNRLTPRASEDCFIARLDAQGRVVWLKQSEGPGSMGAWRLAADAEGNAYLTGELNGDATLDGAALRRVGSRNLFLAKFSPTGKLLWALRDGDGSAEARGVAVDHEGSVFVTGSFSSKPVFQAGTFETPPRTHDMFIAKYDSNGKPLWARSAGWDRSKTGHNVAVDSAGNAHVVGLYQTNRSSNNDNVYLARYSTSGEFLGVRPYQKGDADFSNIVSVELTDAGTSLRANSKTNEVASAKESVGAASAAIRSALSGVREPQSNTTPNAPVLQVLKSGAFAVLYWSRAFAGFELESSDTLAPFPIWEPVVAKPESSGAYMTVAVPITGTAKFFRLHKP